MSRATAVKKKPVAKTAKAVKAKKAVARAAAPKPKLGVRAPTRDNKPSAAKRVVRIAKPATKPALTAAVSKVAAKPAPKPVSKAPVSKAPVSKAPVPKAPVPKAPASKAPARPAPKAAPTPAWKPTGAKSEQRYAGMTETEIMRAPASQYMNSAQLAFFRERLLATQRELLEKADLTSEHLREHDIEPDPTDQATIEEEYALELRARDRERKLLKKIEQSLRRIEDGSYGYCEETGDAIGIPRMLARPTATLTIEAQSRRELKQKLYGD